MECTLVIRIEQLLKGVELRKKLMAKGHVLYDLIYVTFLK